MVQSVELLFDERTEAALTAAWLVLHEAGLPSLATNHSDSNRPHVTVAVAEHGLERAIEPLGRALSESLGPDGMAATLGGYVLFGGHRHRFVLARAVVLSRPLQALHTTVHDVIQRSAPEAEAPANVLPDAWTPHATLARRVPAERLGEALALLDPAPLDARFRAARLWDSGPRTVTPLVG